jgi:hypothetical protein
MPYKKGATNKKYPITNLHKYFFHSLLNTSIFAKTLTYDTKICTFISW